VRIEEALTPADNRRCERLDESDPNRPDAMRGSMATARRPIAQAACSRQRSAVAINPILVAIDERSA